MPVLPASRVNYFDRQYIRLAELQDEQAYHVALRRRHNLSHHSWGIVLGLEIVREDDGRPAVRPGLAVDGYGRECLLLDHQVFGRDTFDRYGTTRLDLWLEYQVEYSDDRLAPTECDGGGDPRRRYRAIERAVVVPTRGGARPDPRHPPPVPAIAFEEPMLATPDDQHNRWPVYLGRIVMLLPASGPPTFDIDVADRVYVGLNAEIIDHPGDATRLELGRRPLHLDTKTIGDQRFNYAEDSQHDFALFVPGPVDPLQPTLAVYGEATQIRGTTEVHGNLVLDGASLQFPPDPSGITNADTNGEPSLYRTAEGTPGDELRIDMGELNNGERRLVLGVTKDGQFNRALEITIADSAGMPTASVVVHGDLLIQGIIDCKDVRTRTLTEEAAAQLSGMVQAALATP